MLEKVFIRCMLVLALPAGAWGQTIGTVDPKPLPPLTNPDDPETPAGRNCFGRKDAPAPLEARALGWYAKGCLAGAAALPVNGETWQVMRLSRNRNRGITLSWCAWSSGFRKGGKSLVETG